MNWEFNNGQKLLIGMIHCLPLPGTYQSSNAIGQVIERAVSDAIFLEQCGFSAVLIENEDLCLDAHMSKVQFAGLSMVVSAVRQAVKLPIGITAGCLNYEESLSIAKVVEADFIRTPIFVDTVMNYNGIIEPCSGKVVAYRKSIGAEHVKILADIQVKHYYMLNPSIDITVSAKWAQRQGADAVIVTGCSTGVATSMEDIKRVKNSVSIPVAVGSGVNEMNIAQQLEIADIMIIGTCLRKDGRMSEPIDENKAAALIRAASRI